MTNADQVAIIQAKLSSGENVVAVHEASLLQGWVRVSRLVALAERDSAYALLVFLTSRQPAQLMSDLTIETVLPVDQHFSCEIDPDSRQKDGSDVYVNVSRDKAKLLFEMPPGVRTSNFVGEIFRAIELIPKQRGSPQFAWLSAYEPWAPHAASEPPLDSPELALPRQNIARGSTTPIAARESVIRHQMALHSDHYTYTELLRVFVGTWNVNGQAPSVPLSDWLAFDEEPPDIYAVGFQELDLSKEAFLFNDTPREEQWQEAVINGLHTKAKYRKVELVRLVGMMLLVFVQEKHFAYVRNVASETVGTGIMGKMGNKGGVAIRMELHSTSVCFVNSHLAAHVEEFERRNQDYHDICNRMSFARLQPPRGIKDHDQVFWLGDLNYRITELDAHIVKDYIAQANYGPILQYDQLNQQHAKRVVFGNYKEGTLTFPPTYKYDTNTDNWDSSEKNRAPAWCDRVLWCGDEKDIRQLAYRSHPALRTSDHKPVSALFTSQVRKIDTAKYRKVHEDVMKKLDKLENEFLPQVTVDNTEIIFDTVRYLEPQTQELIIANTGQVPVTFEFIKKLDDARPCKEWLHIEPYAGFIMPGEKCDVQLEVSVDKRSASRLNAGEDKLYDILVLHLEGGKDIFITVTGTYERSCFGCSIEALVHLSVPIREIPVGRIAELESNSREPVTSQDPYPVPKELWFLVDHLYRHGLKQHQLFLQPGLHSELLLIRHWLDHGSPDPIPGGVHSVAESLLLLLESTSEPLVPFNLHSPCMQAAANYLQCKQIVMQLPEHRKNVFLYLCAFLQELLSHANENGLDAKTIATLFGTVFLRDPPRSRDSARPRPAQQNLDRKKMSFVYHFLVNDQSDLILGR